MTIFLVLKNDNISKTLYFYNLIYKILLCIMGPKIIFCLIIFIILINLPMIFPISFYQYFISLRMGDDGSTYILGLSPLNIAIIGAVASVIVLIIYHFWVTRRSNRHVETFLHRRWSPTTIENNAPPTTVVENNSAVAELLHSY